MLSYRHGFHAGNFADVLKHLVLSKSLAHLIQKDAAILYLDTHAGAGQYSINSNMATKTGEYQQGIGAIDLNLLDDGIEPYRQLLQQFQQQNLYPGSPAIAQALLRPQDQLRLFELHPQDFQHLKQHHQSSKHIICSQTDGYQALKALLPAQQKRALVLIDPSYEQKQEYQWVFKALQQAYQRMPNALYLLWYPVVKRGLVQRLFEQIKQSKIRDAWCYELGLQADNNDFGMTASGMIAINPAWTLAAQLPPLLEELCQQLKPANQQQDDCYYRVKRLTEE